MHGVLNIKGSVCALTCVCIFPVFAATYYVDSHNGNDGASGTSTLAAWKTLTRFNAATFQPGDTILFKRGSEFTGLMQVHGSGTSVAPIIIDAYGTSDSLPRIDGGGITDAVLVSGVDYWEINNLEVTNLSATRPTTRRGGVHLQSTGVTRHHIHVGGLYVHDVNGDLTKGAATEGCGILFDGGAFDDLRIENCHLLRTDRNGICQQSSTNTRSTGVVISGNLLEDIGGDCIKLWGTNHGLVEHNVVRGGHMRCPDPAAGLWPFSSDSCVFQFNEVSGMMTCNDGQAFDVDYSTRGTIMQYNYSHDNQGGFMLMCSPGSSYSDQCIIRYNISQNDGISAADYPYPGVGYHEGSIFLIGGQETNGQIYNNTIYVPASENIYLLYVWSWSNGIPANMTFSNNIFWVEGTVTFDLMTGTNFVFQNNVYYGGTGNNFVGRPTDAQAITIKPPLAHPGNADSGWGSLADYAFSAADTRFLGRVMANNGGSDILGNGVPASQQPLVGAVQGLATATVSASYYRLDPQGPWMKITGARGSLVQTIAIGMEKSESAELNVVNTRGQVMIQIYKGLISAG